MEFFDLVIIIRKQDFSFTSSVDLSPAPIFWSSRRIVNVQA